MHSALELAMVNSLQKVKIALLEIKDDCIIMYRNFVPTPKRFLFHFWLKQRSKRESETEKCFFDAIPSPNSTSLSQCVKSYTIDGMKVDQASLRHKYYALLDAVEYQRATSFIFGLSDCLCNIPHIS